MGRGQTPPPGQRSTRSSKARGSEPHGGCWVPLPTSDAAGALSSTGRAEGSEMELDLGCPLPQAAQGIPRPLLPQAQPHPRAGQGPGQQAARGRIRAGSSSQPPSRWVFLSLFPVSNLPVSQLFPLRAISSPGSAVSGRCEGSSSWPHTINHPPSLSTQHRAPTTGSLPLVITSAHTLGLKYMVRNRSV